MGTSERQSIIGGYTDACHVLYSIVSPLQTDVV